MVSWYWLIVAAWVGGLAAFLVFALLSACARFESRRIGTE
jgi:hypothetical protein